MCINQSKDLAWSGARCPAYQVKCMHYYSSEMVLVLVELSAAFNISLSIPQFSRKHGKLKLGRRILHRRAILARLKRHFCPDVRKEFCGLVFCLPLFNCPQEDRQRRTNQRVFAHVKTERKARFEKPSFEEKTRFHPHVLEMSERFMRPTAAHPQPGKREHHAAETQSQSRVP